MAVIVAVVTGAVAPSGAATADGTIRRIAGGGFGDGGRARDAVLMGVAGISFDRAGDLYIADMRGHRVRRVSGGSISTIAGSTDLRETSITYSPEQDIGDGGRAVDAKLHLPVSAVHGPDGALYISDSQHHRIRRVYRGRITTIAGTGIPGFSGDGGPATRARLDHPGSLAFDGSGNLYVADVLSDRIRRISRSGIIRTVAGGGSPSDSFGDGGAARRARLWRPGPIVIGPDGALYVGDRYRVRKIARGIIRTVVGSGLYGHRGDGGSARRAQLKTIGGITVDRSGRIFVADTGNQRVRMVDARGIITTIAYMDRPTSLALKGNYLYVARGHEVARIRIGRDIHGTSVAGNGDVMFAGHGIAATDAAMFEPHGVVTAPDGTIYVSDTYNHRVRKISPSGIITTIAGNGKSTDWWRQGGYSGDGGPATQAALSFPHGLALDPSGNLYIADTRNARIRMVDRAGIITTVVGRGSISNVDADRGDGGPARDAQLRWPVAVAFDASSNLYIADRNDHRIRKVSPDGIISTFAGTGRQGFSTDLIPATVADLNLPSDVAAGPGGDVFIADAGNHRVRRVDVLGIISTYAGTGEPGSTGDGGPAIQARLSPHALTLDGSDLYVSDVSGNVIRRVAGGMIDVAVGDRAAQFLGEGGSARAARLGYPRALAIAPDGDLIVADTLHLRIRRADL